MKPLPGQSALLQLTDAEEGHAGEPIDVVAAAVVSYRPAKHGTDVILSGGAFIPVREAFATVRRLLAARLREAK